MFAEDTRIRSYREKNSCSSILSGAADFTGRVWSLTLDHTNGEKAVIRDSFGIISVMFADGGNEAYGGALYKKIEKNHHGS
ncbi:hypothetical protein J437_LFUL018754 [Ladona fulva]|uniref:Uncharacterized protein n=1 Tax=Ladona fulva TaxID=123851 RepID=A0A8K0KRZ2_LADFU|nr:hypothetical protein J437_LFUL018754 [Ladona fulva]